MVPDKGMTRTGDFISYGTSLSLGTRDESDLGPGEVLIDVGEVSHQRFGAGSLGLDVVGNLGVVAQGGCSARPCVRCSVADPISEPSFVASSA
jgi:hypothetical protein